MEEDKKTTNFNYAYTNWQYVSGKAIAPGAYNRVRLYFDYDYNTNDAYFTQGYIYKEDCGQTYTYDKNGNVVSTVDLAKTKANFAYKNDQLSKLCNPTGSNYFYTMDDNKNLKYASSTDGQRYSFTYDSFGNPLTSKINVEKLITSVSDIKSNKQYYLFNAYNGNILHSGSNTKGSLTCTWHYKPEDNGTRWQFVKSGVEQGVYQIKTMQIGPDGDLVLDVDGATNNNGANICIYTRSSSAPNQTFKLVSNGDSSFSIRTKNSSYTKCIDGQPGDSTSTEVGGRIQQWNYDANDYGESLTF